MADIYTFLLQNYPGLTKDRIASMDDYEKWLYMRRLEENNGSKDAPMTPKQACINRWVGHGMSYEKALEKWKASMGDSEG